MLKFKCGGKKKITKNVLHNTLKKEKKNPFCVFFAFIDVAAVGGEGIWLMRLFAVCRAIV